jgi:hypothetical protein
MRVLIWRSAELQWDLFEILAKIPLGNFSILHTALRNGIHTSGFCTCTSNLKAMNQPEMLLLSNKSDLHLMLRENKFYLKKHAKSCFSCS